MKNDKVRKIFQGISNKMLVDFNEISQQVNHSGEKGKVREKVLIEFLKKYLPKKYSIGQGEIIDIEGNISPQCDIVIYDAINYPLFLIEDDYQLFPIESVYCVIEVKSKLDNSEIKDCVSKIKTIKSLHGGEKISGVVFSYSTRFLEKPFINKVAENLLKLNDEIKSKERIDIINILDDGIMVRHPSEDDYNGAYELFLELAIPNLNIFLMSLFDKLSSDPNAYYVEGESVLSQYSTGEIGFVKKIPECYSEYDTKY